jgi:hypothetical protein
MKKVKIMLLAALVVASVGGALAFKAVKGQSLFCGPTPFDCPTPTTDWKYDAVGANISFCSDFPSHDCLPVITNK